MIQLLRLRQFIPNGEKELKTFHKFFDPPITAPSVTDLFSDVEKYVSQIPKGEDYNVYFTACKSKPGTREFIEQDIIPFDIDNIDVEKKEQYIEPICAVLGVGSDEVAITFSGNGLQIIIGLKNAFKDKKFFEEKRNHYKAICEKIDEKLKEFNLPGNSDSSVFSTARILRVPETLNRKPGKQERRAKLLRKNILSNGFDLESISGIPELKRGDFIASTELKRFPSPDVSGVLEGCDFLKHIKNGHYSEPEWYAALSIIGRLPDALTIAHEYSKTHRSYTVDGKEYNPTKTETKLSQAVAASGPRTCENINTLWGKCPTCPSFQKIKTPMLIRSVGFVPEKIGTKVTERFVVQKMLEQYGENIVKKNGDLFFYRNGYWRYLDDDAVSLIKNQISDLFDMDSKNKDTESAFRSFINRIPVALVDMFKPNPYCVNFKNGTLHIFKKDNQCWGKEFKKHNRDDFLINQLDFDYLPENNDKNTEFLAMLDRVFEKDDDKLEKILAVKLMYGACLIPAFPHLFMLHGESGTGKTSVILPLYEFLKEENICSVEPYQLTGFAMETMAGKLVNIVTDINTQKPIEDANLKKIEDRIPVKIDRKFKSVVYAPLPAIHIFGANDIPPTLEGASRAHSRRWTFIEFKSFQATGVYDKSFAQWAFNTSPRGVLNFALEGLDELLMSQGHFINPSSGKTAINEWMEDGDVIQQFLNDIEHGEVLGIKKSTGAEILRSDFHEIFELWTEAVGHKNSRSVCSRNRFFKILRKKKVTDSRKETGWFFAGYYKC